ncbi:MAG: hypothetical protein AAF664_18000 [Planctomycetota bacterium]
MNTSNSIDFLYDGVRVGVLDPGGFPRKEGVISYMPYRSGSHLALHQAITAADSPECTCEIEGVAYSFVVESCLEYGRLVVRDVRSG